LRFLLRLPERLLLTATDAFLFVSESECELARLEFGLAPERCAVAPNALPDGFAGALLPRDEARRRLGIRGEELLIGVPGRLCRQKGQDILLDALALPAARDLTGTVLLAGDGPMRPALERRASLLPGGCSVRFAGYVPGLERLYAAFDLVVLPSRFEGLSYALLEAAGAGIPVLASDIPANRPGAVLSPAVRTVPVGDACAWAEALGELPACLAARRESAISGRAGVAAAFSAAGQVSRLRACYEALALRRRLPFFS
jgi:glycosyltransferase involved in cell wall biosynthesis